jgi:hypothetical protein
MRPRRQINLSYTICGYAVFKSMVLLKDAAVLIKTLSLNIDGERI